MKLNVWTFNLRYAAADDGINAFENRKQLIQRAFPKYQADIVGFQEVLPRQRLWLEEFLEGYTIVGTRRGKKLDDESNVIAYRTDRFLTVSLDTFWLSDTPFIPGSRFSTDQSSCPRICTCVVLMHRETGKLLRFYNTHLDFAGEISQCQGMTVILNRISADDARYPNVPLVLTGDFNAVPGSRVCTQVAAFSSCGKPLKDLTAGIRGTYHAYQPEETLDKIDYIFTDAAADPSRTMALTEQENGVFLSDHYPVLAEITL